MKYGIWNEEWNKEWNMEYEMEYGMEYGIWNMEWNMEYCMALWASVHSIVGESMTELSTFAQCGNMTNNLILLACKSQLPSSLNGDLSSAVTWPQSCSSLVSPANLFLIN